MPLKGSFLPGCVKYYDTTVLTLAHVHMHSAKNSKKIKPNGPKTIILNRYGHLKRITIVKIWLQFASYIGGNMFWIMQIKRLEKTGKMFYCFYPFIPESREKGFCRHALLCVVPNEETNEAGGKLHLL